MGDMNFPKRKAPPLLSSKVELNGLRMSELLLIHQAIGRLMHQDVLKPGVISIDGRQVV